LELEQSLLHLRSIGGLGSHLRLLAAEHFAAKLSSRPPPAPGPVPNSLEDRRIVGRAPGGYRGILPFPLRVRNRVRRRRQLAVPATSASPEGDGQRRIGQQPVQ